MRIAVLGTGVVGQTLAAGFAARGNEVTVGTRDPAATMARISEDVPPPWAGDPPLVALATFAHSAQWSDVVVNATSGDVSLEVLSEAGGENLAGKILLDVANPLDFSRGMPPTLFVKDSDSLAEHIQRAFPDARVVKALNTMTAPLMVEPGLVPGGFTTFVSGNDDAAKKVVFELLRTLGHEDIIDLGDITTARGSEMILPLWLRVMVSLGTPIFGFKIVR